MEKTLAIHLEELREEIAQEIEQRCNVGRCTNYEGTWICSHYIDAMIARGKK